MKHAVTRLLAPNGDKEAVSTTSNTIIFGPTCNAELRVHYASEGAFFITHMQHASKGHYILNDGDTYGIGGGEA